MGRKTSRYRPKPPKPPRVPKPPPIDPALLITIEQLADRWKVSIEKAKKVVLKQGVPIVGERLERIDWTTARFHRQDVLRWEAEATCIYDPVARATRRVREVP